MPNRATLLKVLLTFMNVHSNPNRYADQWIVVRGTLYRAIRSEEHTSELQSLV